MRAYIAPFTINAKVGDDLWYIISVLCFISLILGFIPLCHALYHLWIKKSEKISNITKIIVSLSLILLFCHVSDHTFFRLCQWVSGGFGISMNICIMHIWILSVAYYIGKSLMYSYFVLRAHYIFKETPYRYKASVVYCCIISINILSISLTIIWSIIAVGLMDVVTVESTKGRQCYISSSDDDGRMQNVSSDKLLSYILISSTTLDILFSIITVWMLVAKLFNISNVLISEKRKTEYVDEFNSASSRKNISKSIEIRKNSSKLVEIDEQSQVRSFHRMTKSENNMLILSTKLLVLAMVAIISTQITLLLFIWISQEVYVFDSCLNIYCLWLTFRFAQHYYTKIFCGDCCIRTYFPCLKMIAVGCDKEDENKNVINCCCCCCCCVESQYKEYYYLSKQEYQLFLAKQGNKYETEMTKDLSKPLLQNE